MNEQQNTALVRKLYDAFARGDIKTILDNLTGDVEWIQDGPSVIPYAGRKTGATQVRQFFDALVGTQENVKLTLDHFISQGDEVATLGRYAATVKATGKQFDSRVAHFFTIRDGKVSRWIGTGDTTDAVAAYLGTSAAGAR
ncbi:MAG: nuclear transport factor 2 family protein [Bryobacteraceae bacterium]